MVGFGGQTQVRLRDYYQQVLQGIIDEQGIDRVEWPDHVVPANTEWVEVVQHTEWYVGGSADSREHYRYRRYMEVMGGFTPGDGRVALADLGCGAGLFSWVFLDWATRRGVGYHRLSLYGLDHCPAMLRLALEARQRLLQHVPDYPELHCRDDVEALCNQLTENHRQGTDYIVTLGHVLVQAHTPDAIQNFTRVIGHVMELIEPGRNCALVAVDASRERDAFAEGWTALLDSLARANICYAELPIAVTPINNNGRAKRAWLSLAR